MTGRATRRTLAAEGTGTPTARWPPADTPGEGPMCSHVTQCPEADSENRDLAVVVSSHPEQGWRLLCNGVVLFDDDGELLPDGRAVSDHHIWQAMGSLAAS